MKKTIRHTKHVHLFFFVFILPFLLAIQTIRFLSCYRQVIANKETAA